MRISQSIKRFLSSLNLNDILEDNSKLKDIKPDKCFIPNFDSFNHLFDDINNKIKKFESEIEEINLDNLYLFMQNKDYKGNIDYNCNKDILQGYLAKDDFDTYIKENEDELYRIKKEINKIKKNVSQVMNEGKKKGDLNELNNLRGNLLEKMEELVKAYNLKFTDKNVFKNFIEDH